MDMKFTHNGKRIIVGLTVVCALLHLLLWTVSMPGDAVGISVAFSCVKIDADGKPITQPDRNGVISSNLNGIGEICLNAAVKHIKGVKTDEKPSDVQLVELYYSDADAKSVKKILLARDFYTGKTFVSHDGGEWRAVLFPSRLDGVLTNALEATGYSLYNWRGKAIYSSYCWDEPRDFNDDDMTFRYNLFWMPNGAYDELRGYKTSGFNNTEPVEIKTKEDAINRAAEEFGFEDPIAVTFYDETCGYWLVEIYENTTYTPIDKSGYGDYLSDLSFRGLLQTVIMDDKGITLETYYGFTRYEPFFELAGL